MSLISEIAEIRNGCFEKEPDARTLDRLHGLMERYAMTLELRFLHIRGVGYAFVEHSEYMRETDEVELSGIFYSDANGFTYNPSWRERFGGRVLIELSAECCITEMHREMFIDTFKKLASRVLEDFDTELDELVKRIIDFYVQPE